MKIQQRFASQTVSVRVFSDVWACIFCLQVQGCLVLRRISHANWSDHIPSMWGRWVVTSPEYFYFAITHTQNGLVVVLSTLVCVYIYITHACVCVCQTNKQIWRLIPRRNQSNPSDSSSMCLSISDLLSVCVHTVHPLCSSQALIPQRTVLLITHGLPTVSEYKFAYTLPDGILNYSTHGQPSSRNLAV